MRLSELKPKFWQRYVRFTPEQGGIDPLPEMGLSFTCPKCGPPGIVAIIVTTGDPNQTDGKWHVSELPHVDNLDRMTIVPSIRCHAQMHGPRQPPCNAHFSIVNGEVT